MIASLLGRPTVAAVAVFPVLLGLASTTASNSGPRARAGKRAGARGCGHAARGGPAIVIAALATTAGFLALLISPVPMVRGFGVLLMVGVAVALASPSARAGGLALAERALGATRRVVARRGRDPALLGRPVIRRRRPTIPIRGRRRSAASGSCGHWRITAARGVLAVALVLAVAGWVLGTQTAVQSDITKLVPSGMPALRHLDRLERVSGVSGEVDVLVHARNVASPAVSAGCTPTSSRSLAHSATTRRRVRRRDAVPGAVAARPAGAAGERLATGRRSLRCYGRSPVTSQRAVLTSTTATRLLAFGIRLMPLRRAATGDRADARGAGPAAAASALGSPACRCSRRTRSGLARPRGGC